MLQNRKYLKLPLIFLAGFILCLVICRFTAGQLQKYTTTDLSKIYLFLYVNLPCAIGRFIGLQEWSLWGHIYTLSASLFYLVMAGLFYNYPTQEEFSDYANGESADSMVRRGFHYGCSFLLFQMICLPTVEIDCGLDFVRDPGFSCFAAPVLFLLFTGIEFACSKTPAQKWKSIYRLLASICMTFGVAGIAGKIFDAGESSLVLPIAIRQLLIRFADICGTSIWGSAAMFLIMGACAVLLALSVRMVLFPAKDLNPSIVTSGAHVLLLFGFYYLTTYFNDDWYTGVINTKTMLYWVYILAIAIVWTLWCIRKSWRHAAVMGVGTVGFFTMLPACLDSLRAFSGGISHNLDRLSSLGQPIESKVMALVAKIQPGHWTFVAFLILLILVVLVLFKLLYAPLFPDKDKEYALFGHPSLVMICSLVFLLGYAVSCLSHTLWQYNWVTLVGYYLCAIAVMAGIACLSACLFARYTTGTRFFLSGIVSTLIWAVLLSLFTQLISAVVAGLAILFVVCGVFSYGTTAASDPRNRAVTRSALNDIWGASVLSDISDLEKSGDISSAEAAMATGLVLAGMQEIEKDIKKDLQAELDALSEE